MSRTKKETDDPVVEEVRRIRAQLWKKAGGTVKGLRTLLDKEFPFPVKAKKPSSKVPARSRKSHSTR